MNQETSDIPSPWKLALGLNSLALGAYAMMRNLRPKPTHWLQLSEEEQAAITKGFDPALMEGNTELGRRLYEQMLAAWATEGYRAYWFRTKTDFNPARLEVDDHYLARVTHAAFLEGWLLAEAHELLGEGPHHPSSLSLDPRGYTLIKLLEEARGHAAETKKLREEAKRCEDTLERERKRMEEMVVAAQARADEREASAVERNAQVMKLNDELRAQLNAMAASSVQAAAPFTVETGSQLVHLLGQALDRLDLIEPMSTAVFTPEDIKWADMVQHLNKVKESRLPSASQLRTIMNALLGSMDTLEASSPSPVNAMDPDTQVETQTAPVHTKD